MTVLVPLLLGAVFGLSAVALWQLRQPQVTSARSDGTQEIAILVKGKYHPQRFRARIGVPLRMRFIRDEDDDCSRWVVFPDFGIERSIPAFRTTTVELLPDSAGDFLFTCRMGMYQGSFTVVPHRSRQLRWPAARSDRSRSAEPKRSGSSRA